MEVTQANILVVKKERKRGGKGRGGGRRKGERKTTDRGMKETLQHFCFPQIITFRRLTM